MIEIPNAFRTRLKPFPDLLCHENAFLSNTTIRTRSIMTRDRSLQFRSLVRKSPQQCGKNCPVSGWKKICLESCHVSGCHGFFGPETNPHLQTPCNPSPRSRPSRITCPFLFLHLARRNRSDFCDLRLRCSSQRGHFRDKRKPCCIAI